MPRWHHRGGSTAVELLKPRPVHTAHDMHTIAYAGGRSLFLQLPRERWLTGQQQLQRRDTEAVEQRQGIDQELMVFVGPKRSRIEEIRGLFSRRRLAGVPAGRLVVRGRKPDVVRHGRPHHPDLLQRAAQQAHEIAVANRLGHAADQGRPFGDRLRAATKRGEVVRLDQPPLAERHHVVNQHHRRR